MSINLSDIPSLSARRAWIEISNAETAKTSNAVALRKESVDRNIHAQNFCVCVIVALRKESVDRNKIRIAPIDGLIGRSPQGERG